MRKLFISLCFSACCSLLAAQTTNPIQEAMANYDYETALMLIDQETPTGSRSSGFSQSPGIH